MTPAVSTTPVGNRQFLGQFGNATATLSLADLPVHDSVTVSFDVYVLRSWDGNHPTWGGTGTPKRGDRFAFAADGVTRLDTTFRNWRTYLPGDATLMQEYAPTGTAPNGFTPSGVPLFDARTGAAEVNTLGYTFAIDGKVHAVDSVYRFEYTLPHTAAALTLAFRGSGLQGLTDESWGLDNVRVSAELTGKIGGIAWVDDLSDTLEEGDGLRRDDELGLPNATVSLLDQNQSLLAQTKTDSSGVYQFTNLPLGTFSVRLDSPNRLQFTKQNQGIDESRDSDVDANGIALVVLTADQPINVKVDAGVAAPISFSAPRALSKGEECLLAVVHVGVNNLTEKEFDKLRTTVTINDAVIAKPTLQFILDQLKGVKNLTAAQAATGVITATVSLAEAEAITLPPLMTGDETIRILAKANGLISGHFDGTFTQTGGINSLPSFALEAHELQHAVQIVKDGTNDGRTFLSDYLDDFAGQYARRSAEAILAAGGDVTKVDFGKVQKLAYNGIMFEIQAYALDKAIQAVFLVQANLDKYNAICEKVYDPKVGLKSLADNKDVADLRALLVKEYTTRLALEIKANRAN